MNTSTGGNSQGKFLLGATLLGHSVEGGNYASDWWHWEQRPGRIRGDATSQTAAGHFERYAGDIAFATRFGLNALLIGVEWSRVEPEEGVFDEGALAHYADVLRCAREHGASPFVALHHVAAPHWFSDGFGWGHSRAPELFTKYVAHMVGALGSMCVHWIPWHEPTHWFVNAGLERRWPSGPSAVQLPRALRNIRTAHASAYTAIKANNEDAQVGYTIRARRFVPRNAGSLWDQRAAVRAQSFCNRISVPHSQVDFLGISFFGPEQLQYSLRNPRQGFSKRTESLGNAPDEPVCVAEPEQFRTLIREFRYAGMPLYITGNGIATDDDNERIAFLQAHHRVVREERETGTDIRGYFHHALLDGFEWTSGYDRRYGLVHVDRKALARTPNPSAFTLQRLVAEPAARERKVARS